MIGRDNFKNIYKVIVNIKYTAFVSCVMFLICYWSILSLGGYHPPINKCFCTDIIYK